MDIFYTLEWAKLFEKQIGGKAEIFKFGNGEKEIVFPFIKRRINDLPFASSLESEYFDITSPYGYGGIFVSAEAKKDKDFLSQFFKSWDDYCHRENIVSEFIRFHPLDQNHEMFGNLYSIKQINENVVLDLTPSEEEILADMDKRHCYSIRRAVKNGVRIVWDKEFAHMADFRKLYSLTMDRDTASQFYYFGEDFFDNLKNSFSESIKLVFAELNGKIVATSLFIFNPDNVYYFLSGANNEALFVCANHLLLYNVALEAKCVGKKFFNLGGGLTKNDSLSLFKAGFSKIKMPFFVGTRIDNQIIYDKLVRLAGIKEEEVNYFPLYRYGL